MKIQDPCAEQKVAVIMVTQHPGEQKNNYATFIYLK